MLNRWCECDMICNDLTCFFVYLFLLSEPVYILFLLTDTSLVLKKTTIGAAQKLNLDLMYALQSLQSCEDRSCCQIVGK